MTARIEEVSARARGTIRRMVLAPTSAPPSQRLVSLDALRGFTMVWIIGAQEIVLALVALVAPAWLSAFDHQMHHPAWEGFVAWDLIMPSFLFLVGASMPFAFAKYQAENISRREIYGRIGRRFVVLWLMGMVAQNFVFEYDINEVELFSNTLQAIAVGYVATSLALLHLSRWGQVALFAALTVGYWALLTFVPFGGYPAGTLEQHANFARHVDEFLMGRFRRDHDYTWIVTSMSFAAMVLLGAQAGHLLRSRLEVARKLAAMVGLGVALMAAGYLWSYWHPLNRHIWTSSMVLWSGGFSFLLLALFYGVIDVAGIKKWSYFLVVIGANALLAYVFTHVFGSTFSDILVSNLAAKLPVEAMGDLLEGIVQLGVLWLILWYLYQNRTFLRA